MNPALLADIADEAHRKTLSANDATTRAYAAGVADLAALLAQGLPPGSGLVAILAGGGPELRRMIPAG
jgi:hypothetical protein